MPAAPSPSTPPQPRRPGHRFVRPALAAADDLADPAPPGRHGDRLVAAFAALEAFPALAESQVRGKAVLDEPLPDLSRLVPLVETDLGLGLAVLRAAARTPGAGPATVAEALGRLDRVAMHVIAEQVPAVDVLDRPSAAQRAALAHRRHAVAVQTAVQQIAARVPGLRTDVLCTAALVHDVGKLVLHQVRRHPAPPDDPRTTPEQALEAERATFGVDHQTVGGVLLRRWGLSPTLVRIVEHHHGPQSDRDASALHLADLVAHHGAGRAVAPQALAAAAGGLGLSRSDVRALLHDQTRPGDAVRRAAPGCPLSRRESEVLELLADGLHYHEIADVLGVAVSTARTHLHNIYGKLGVANRAQAVLKAADNRWLAGPRTRS